MRKENISEIVEELDENIESIANVDNHTANGIAKSMKNIFSDFKIDHIVLSHEEYLDLDKTILNDFLEIYNELVVFLIKSNQHDFAKNILSLIINIKYDQSFRKMILSEFVELCFHN